MLITDNRQIVNILNNFFVTLPQKLLISLPTIVRDWVNNHVTKVRKEIFQISHITSDEILKLLQCMLLNKATGVDGLSARVLHAAAPGISPSLSRLINHCIDKSYFPAIWKKAKVIPIYKGKGDKQEMNNYRPVSVLPSLSKIFEKHIHDSLYSYLKNTDQLYKFQSGFRKSHSTELPLIRLIDQLLFNLDKNHLNGLIFIDYKKAFDLIDHGILIHKLNEYGLGSNELALFTSYLQDRHQFVQIEGYQSETTVNQLLMEFRKAQFSARYFSLCL